LAFNPAMHAWRRAVAKSTPVLVGTLATLWAPKKRLLLEDKPDKTKPDPPNGGSKKAAPATRTINVDQEMIKTRRVFLTGEVNDESAKVLVQQLMFLQAEDPDAPITLFINSGGGLVHSGLAILDVMSTVTTPVKTVAYGRCFSIAALLLAAGAPGERSAYANARLMIHEPSCSYPKLQASDIMIKAEELRHTKVTLERVLTSLTGRSKAEIGEAVARDNYMSVAEARSFGLIDNIVTSPPRSAPPSKAVVSAPSVAPDQPNTQVDTKVAAATACVESCCGDETYDAGDAETE